MKKILLITSIFFSSQMALAQDGYEGNFVECDSEFDFNREAYRLSLPSLDLLDSKYLSLSFFDESFLCQRALDENLENSYLWHVKKYEETFYWITSYYYKDPSTTLEKPELSYPSNKILEAKQVWSEEPKEKHWLPRGALDGAWHIEVKIPLFNSLTKTGLLNAKEKKTLKETGILVKTFTVRRLDGNGGLRLVIKLTQDQDGNLSLQKLN